MTDKRTPKILEATDWRSWAISSKRTSTDRPGIRKRLAAEVVKTTDPDSGAERYTFTASTDSVDRESDVIDPRGWALDDFKRNPVILWAHDHTRPPIGKATSVGVTGNKLKVEIVFTPESANPEGARVRELVDAGFLKAVSVGFRPLKYTFNAERQGYDFAEQELLEVSVVPVPANPEALVAAGLKGTTAKWFKTETETFDVEMSEAEVKELINKTIRKQTGEIVETDMTEDELKRAIHKGIAAEITRTTGRLVDDLPPVRTATEAAICDAVRAALEVNTLRNTVDAAVTDVLSRLSKAR